MRPGALAAAIAVAALLTYFPFPGHTWLQQDSQIYAAILKHQRDLLILRNDILAQHPTTKQRSCYERSPDSAHISS
jgi:hypothetical protein